MHMCLSVKKNYISVVERKKCLHDNDSDCTTNEKSTRLLFHNVAEGILLDSKRVKSILSSNC